MKISEFIFQFEDLNNTNELVFFGGSFNPWHDGHTSCIKLLDPKLPVVIVPDHNPFKDLVNAKDKHTSPDQILNRVRFLNRNIFIYEGFLIREEKNPTNVWIEELKMNLPLTKISFLVGYDTFKNMPQWINIEKLLKNLDCLYVASRLEKDQSHQNDTDSLHLIHSQVEVNFLGHHQFEHLSSTEIRTK